MTLPVAAAIALFVIPLIALRGRSLVRCLSLQVAVYLVAAVVSRQIGGFDPYLGTVALFVVQLAIGSIFIAASPAIDVRWSAARAALIALLVYALMIPAMLRTPTDGDEPFYLLITESIAHDGDLDLANQYRDLAHSATGRTDLKPQLGDLSGPRGEQYSRHEPFLPLLLVPGYLAGGLYGALATIAIFGSLLVRSTVRMFEDEGIDEATIRATFPLFAFAPPIVFYAARLWPEVPAAFAFVETIRGVRARRAQRWIPAVLALSFLKLRFLLIAPLLLLAALKAEIRKQKAEMEVDWRSISAFCLLLSALLLPLLAVHFTSGGSVHSLTELLPAAPRLYANGFFGLILDGAAGLLFQAPFYVLGVLALARWRETPRAFRLGILTSLLYIVTLVPRAEWHGGWSPPLRYIVFLMPVLALGAAAIWRRISGGVIALISLWTAGVVVHGVAFPYRLFHIENGENAAGEALSRLYHSDFSRLFPSFIRPNTAAWIAAALFVVILLVCAAGSRIPNPESRIVLISLAAALVAGMFVIGQRPGHVIEFEDAHVVHKGGELYPPEYTVARFLYHGGWIVRTGDSLSFLARGGPARLQYSASQPAMIQLAGRAYQLDTGGSARVEIPHAGRVVLRCLAGSVNLDRMVSD